MSACSRPIRGMFKRVLRNKSRRSQMFFKIDDLKYFVNFTGKYLVLEFLFNKIGNLKVLQLH